MQLQFKNNKNASEFSNWLKGFKDIQNSLLLEIDLVENAFIAKCFPSSKSIVRYSKLSFEDAGFELLYINDNEKNAVENWSETYGSKFDGGNRVKIGLYEMLPTFINYINLFNDVPFEMTIDFDLCKQVQYIQDGKPYPEYQVTDIVFKSQLLTIHVAGSKISEFFYRCTDELFFNNVYSVKDPVVFDIAQESINNLIKVSSVTKVAGKNSIKLYTKTHEDKICLYAYDYDNNAYDYLLGTLQGDAKCDNTYVVISRDNFINAVKGIDSNLQITLDQSSNAKLLIGCGDAKVVVASIIGA